MGGNSAGGTWAFWLRQKELVQDKNHAVLSIWYEDRPSRVRLLVLAQNPESVP